MPSTAAKRLLLLTAVLSLTPMLILWSETSKAETKEPERVERVQKTKRKASGGKDLIESVEIPSNWKTTDEHLRTLAARRHHVMQVCKELGLDQPSVANNLNSWEFVINKEHNLVWCNVFKSASSTWFWNFNILAGYSEKDLLVSKIAPVELARRRYPRPSVEELQAFMAADPPPISFMITRDPLERLVSAYRNKIVTGNPIYKPLFKMIYSKYRHLGPPVARRKKDWSLVGGGETAPSFSQFVQYVLDEETKGKTLDMHWIPQSRFCTPCLANFTIYAKTDTLIEDGNHIIFSSGINNIIRPKIINRSVTPSSVVTKSHICELPEELIEGLLALYNLDMKLFQFDSSRYRNCEDEPLRR